MTLQTLPLERRLSCALFARSLRLLISCVCVYRSVYSADLLCKQTNSSLVGLDVAYNKFTDISTSLLSKSIGERSALRELNMEGCDHFTTLPIDFLLHPLLTSLGISRCYKLVFPPKSCARRVSDTGV